VSQTVGQLVSQCLRAAGVVRAFAAPGHGLPPLDGITNIAVSTPEVAIALADADGRLSCAPHAHPGLALLPDGRIRLSSQPGAIVDAQPLAVEDIPAAIAGWSFGRVLGAAEYDLPLDPDAATPDGLQPLVLQPSDQLMRLSPSLATFTTVIVAGPGVIRDGQVTGVAEAAARIGARVVATRGALGVLPIDDPAWCGVVGLQADDPVLAGLDSVELVIAAGVDPDELARAIPPDAQVLEVEPWHLGLMAHHWPDPEKTLTSTDRGLVDALAPVAAVGRSSNGAPLHPVRVLADILEVVENDTVVTADAGLSGLWLTRGLLASRPGQVVCPALGVEGFAVAAAIVVALDAGRAFAVTTAPTDPLTESLLDLAVSLDLNFVVEVWNADAPLTDAAEHRARLVGARNDSGVQRLDIAVDLVATRGLLDLAGPVLAWGDDG
jgi:thiamine pyrophosphate-dependent acetolactate synthase large subunit-like protein